MLYRILVFILVSSMLFMAAAPVFADGTPPPPSSRPPTPPPPTVGPQKGTPTPPPPPDPDMEMGMCQGCDNKGKRTRCPRLQMQASSSTADSKGHTWRKVSLISPCLST